MNQRTENPDTFQDDPVEGLREDALVMVSQCIECGSCYVDCAFGNYPESTDTCKEWIRESNDFILGKRKDVGKALKDANLKCAECNRCHVTCPEDIYRRHGNMYMKHLTGNPLLHSMNIHPYSNWRIKQPAIEKFILPKWEEENRKWYQGLNTMEPAEVLLYHGCYVYSQPDQCIKLEKMLSAAGISFSSVGKIEYCCGTFAFYRGHDDMGTIRPRLLEMVRTVKPRRILTNCGHCFNAMDDLAAHLDEDERPEVRHPVEELLDLNIDRRLEFAHLGKTYSIHDSCNFRSLHDPHGPLRSFLRRIGTIHELMSHGKRGKCCGDVSRYYAPEHIHENNRRDKVREIIGSGADVLVTVCAGCDESFRNVGAFDYVDLMDVAYEAFSQARAEDAEAAKNRDMLFENMAPVMEED